MIFRSEADVRRWIKGRVDALWWIENKRGGSLGVPDSAIALDGKTVWAELKLIKPGPHVEASAAQLNVVEEMREHGLSAVFLGGIEGTNQVAVFLPGDMVRRGRVAGFGRRTRYDVRRFVVRCESENFRKKYLLL